MLHSSLLGLQVVLVLQVNAEISGGCLTEKNVKDLMDRRTYSEDQQTYLEGAPFEDSPLHQDVQTHQYWLLQDLSQLVMQQLECHNFQLRSVLRSGTALALLASYRCGLHVYIQLDHRLV